MRIIAGNLKGCFLKGPKTLEITRPILARVKKSLFDILTPIFREKKSLRFLDLFSGTGAVGIEAISRGADTVFFVEKDREMYKCILDNLEKFKIFEKNKVFCTDVFDFFKNYNGEPFDIVFAGPPYQEKLCNKILSCFADSKVYNKDTILVLQHGSRESVIDENKVLEKFRTKFYGDTILDFFKELFVGE
ncbi:MAG: 16S rRNA (guanine(966)-N(2))-methyltransferase RsmD [Elusimicrobiota bacterium]|nr:16S rRNA (guanine(966)-N(2))-methyltransferase RsmD [Elusimicrobiota bacterium]